MDTKPKLIVICGPTATGKTATSIEIAKNIDGEIISADSRQVYKYLDIGTAKITEEEMQGISHHMINIVEPHEKFSVVQYKQMTHKIIDDIHSRGKTPILVGGTGMYIDAVIHDRTFPEVPPNTELRSKLENKPTTELVKILHKLDQDRAETIDQDNPVRLIRAIEIATTLGSVPKQESAESPYELEIHYMDLPDNELQQKIHDRNVHRLENGLIEEVENLHTSHDMSWERLNELGLEYRYVSQFVQGEIETKEKLIEILDQKTWQYVKRQRTWFKKYL
jgi:tRNA dimethylallyltransferase